LHGIIVDVPQGRWLVQWLLSKAHLSRRRGSWSRVASFQRPVRRLLCGGRWRWSWDLGWCRCSVECLYLALRVEDARDWKKLGGPRVDFLKRESGRLGVLRCGVVQLSAWVQLGCEMRIGLWLRLWLRLLLCWLMLVLVLVLLILVLVLMLMMVLFVLLLILMPLLMPLLMLVMMLVLVRLLLLLLMLVLVLLVWVRLVRLRLPLRWWLRFLL